ncbi:MAG TPA: hypothetical protein VMS02_05625 [Solirubrobacteraceae bacterium]|nr:hypothetical protein [Solirubrobacteraceae bacterium]
MARLNGNSGGHIRQLGASPSMGGVGLATPELGLSLVLVEGGTEETSQALGFGRWV